jgi:hypothetical protein
LFPSADQAQREPNLLGRLSKLGEKNGLAYSGTNHHVVLIAEDDFLIRMDAAQPIVATHVTMSLEIFFETLPTEQTPDLRRD